MTIFIFAYTTIALLHFIYGMIVLYQNQSPYSTENMIGCTLLGLIFPVFYLIIIGQLTIQAFNYLIKVVRKVKR
jgi:hypothetical protein